MAIEANVGGTMKIFGWKMSGLTAGILLICSGIVLAAQDESSDGTPEASREIPYEAQILKYGLENLNYLKNAVPDLHLKVTSPNWMELGGSEKLRIVVKSMSSTWGVDNEAIDDYVSRIDQYWSEVPDGEKSDVEMIFGLIGEHLLRQVFFVEQGKTSVQPLVDVYSIIWEAEDPEKLVKFEQCLNQSMAEMGTNTKLTFVDWLESIEKISDSTDLLTPHVSLHQSIATELVDRVTEAYKAQSGCNPDLQADS